MCVLKVKRSHQIPLKLELLVVLNYCVGAENQTWVLCKSDKRSYLTGEPPFQPLIDIFKGKPKFTKIPDHKLLLVSLNDIQ